MSRRIISVVGILALALVLVPSGPDSIRSVALDCCDGIMCPMHAKQVHAPNCDIKNNGSAALKPCPAQAATHYTASIVFVLVAPMTLHNDAPSEPAIAFFPHLSANAELRIDSPPPRLPLMA